MPFIIAIAVIVVIIVIILNVRSERRNINAEIRGKYGEYRVANTIQKALCDDQYVINDIILSNDDKSAQIDHIVINPRGIFVIETKNYSGRIYGNEKQLEWTQVLAYGKVKNKVYNPLKQNATHVYNVKRIVGNLPVRSYVVFVQNNTEYIDAPYVIPLCRLKYVLHTGETVLTTEQIENAYNLLLSHRADISKEQHIENIHKLQQDLAHGICPRCGGNLVLRNVKNGKFWGCSNYPKCKFTKKY